MKLPINLPLPMMQTRWKSLLDPVLSNPLSGAILLENVILTIGANSVNHKLGRTPIGWFVVDSNAHATVYRSGEFNPLTLNLSASVDVTVKLVVF